MNRTATLLHSTPDPYLGFRGLWSFSGATSYALGQSSEAIAKRYSKVSEETAQRTVGKFHAKYSIEV